MKINQCMNYLRSAGYDPRTELIGNITYIIWLVGTVEHKRRFINGVMV